MTAGTAPTRTAANKPATGRADALPIAGGALAFLAIGGAAVAMTRRRHEEDEDWMDEPTSDEAVTEAQGELRPASEQNMIHREEPPLIAPASSAFSWGNEARTQVGETDDRLPGESWVQRAYRGPSANNPSVSLRTRLKRAAFFDKRERDVAAGKAEPVEMDAGLPDAIVEDQQERELA